MRASMGREVAISRQYRIEGISSQTTDASLRAWFAAQNVPVRDVKILVDPATGASCAFAEITHETFDAGTLSALRRTPLDGSFLRLGPFEATCSACRPDSGVAGMRVLVVDDEPRLRTLVAGLLDSEGATVSTAESGNAGYHVLVREKPDVLLSDLSMPNGSGYDLIERVRRLLPDDGGLTPAIAMSGTENTEDAMMAGFHVFVPKPFDVMALTDTVADFRRLEISTYAPPNAITATAEGELLVTLMGRVESRDIAALVKPLLVHLEGSAQSIVLDIRFVTSFSPSVAATAELSVWTHRHRIRAAHVIGGSFAARLVCAAACRTLGISCTFADSALSAPRAHP